MNTLSAFLRADQISTESAILTNELTVVAHQDSTAPLVAVRVNYHVGSRCEPKSKNGLAHIFEHLMFSGSPRFPGNAFLYLEELGASCTNALSREDYTAYFEAVPLASLDSVLALEADRARFLSGVFDSSELERVREIVRSELIERASEPYGMIDELLAHEGYSLQHPYANPPNGVIAQLDNITLDDTAGWSLLHSNPTNMNLVIVGSIEPHDAIRKARNHFESIRMRPASIPAFALPVNKLINRRIKVSHDHSESRIYVVWDVPGFNSLDRIGFELLLEVLKGAPNSRGFDQMAGEKKIADIEGELRVRELASQFLLWAPTTNPNSFSAIEGQIREQIDRIKRLGISNHELQTARFRLSANISHSFERTVGPGSKAELLSLNWMFSKDANPYMRSLASIASISATHFQKLAGMLGEPALVLEIEGNQTKPRDPAGLYINTTARHAPASGISHSRTSAVFTSKYPIIAASHARSPFFEFRVVVEPGFVGDPFQLKGLATVTANTINAGLTRSSQVGRSSRFESQGMVFSRSIYPDAVSLGVCATEPRKALRLLVNSICVSSIHESAVSRVKQSQISLLAAEQSHPINLAMRVLPELVFGRSDGYGAPWTGAGTEQGVLNISLEDVTSLYRRWRSSGPMKLLAVGPASEEKLLALTTDAFSELFQHRESSHVVLPSVFTSLTHSRIVVASRPRSLQTAIFAAVSISPKTTTQMEALLLADAIFGSAFSSRLNLTLREARQWTYGVHTNLLLGRQSCLWLAYAQVRTNVTAAAMQEIENIWRGLADERPPSPLELRRAKSYIISQLSRQYESSAEIASALERLLLYDLPRWYYSELPKRIERLSVEDVALAYQTAVSQSNLQWLLVGHEESLFSNLACAGYTSVTCM